MRRGLPTYGPMKWRMLLGTRRLGRVLSCLLSGICSLGNGRHEQDGEAIVGCRTVT
ncbi:hypothetical protein AN958_02680 [Leucoagaricus sp. SymC.cos]|nr:hypothetical protein AN958_02680 [Leucoagaricus sp. SymC.cos]